MANYWTIALSSLLLAITSKAQPFTQSELGWYSSQGGAIAINCNGLVAATNIIVVVKTNTANTFTLAGSGGVYSLATQPTNGVLSGFDASSGAITYTETNHLATGDKFVYNVQFGSCVTNAVVDLNIQEDLDSSVGCLTQTGATNQVVTIVYIVGATPFSTLCLYYTNAFCVPAQSCQTVRATGIALFSIIQGVGCPANCLTFATCGSETNITITWGGNSSSSGSLLAAGSTSTARSGGFDQSNRYSSFTVSGRYSQGGTEVNRSGTIDNHSIELQIHSVTNKPPNTNNIYISLTDSGGAVFSTNLFYNSAQTNTFPFTLNQYCSNTVTITFFATNGTPTSTASTNATSVDLIVQ